MDNIIFNSYLYVRPVRFTTQYNIEPYIHSCPIIGSVPKLEELHVTIARTKQSLHKLKIDPESEYIAKISGAEVWLSPVTGKKNIVINLESEDLVKRREEVLQNAEDFYPAYKPHLTICYDIPNNRQDYRWWTNEVLTNYNIGGKYFGQIIKLKGEALGDSVVAPSNYKSSINIRPEL